MSQRRTLIDFWLASSSSIAVTHTEKEYFNVQKEGSRYSPHMTLRRSKGIHPNIHHFEVFLLRVSARPQRGEKETMMARTYLLFCFYIR
ncbi:hypothetical protein SAICODRAFT_148360 [Saitoella complicata NRRL Y-17804]|uniref:uncharacterized protein n=1 Tax=Saitoella complicata (strain BCRC 22490 / CBS 7301 / JCM 7358 / NBRC 10748 / NRRL Y-17804) TaxID=698492 RepID=UPI000868064F|nr:uncharacterized protein SAICODRAFT_148360 [Saitoella complicata NRRL Y-17804]ODQ55560.1 hypothetical protein SAICODRAFT_148360 [Saitoella complicata NRRL Y-17804]